MITAGIDIGSLSTKIILLNQNKIISHAVHPTGVTPEEAVQKAMDKVLQKSGLSSSDIKSTFTTGIGKKKITYESGQATEIICDTKGSLYLYPDIKGIIDIGAETCRAIKCDTEGNIIDFTLNDKCASGTGIFLQSMAKALRVKPEEMGELSLKATQDIEVTSMCAVFAESEVVSLIHRKTPKNDILKGIHKSIASRIYGLANRITLEDDIIVIGGIAKNKGLLLLLEELMNIKLKVPEEPEIVGALGAAILAKEKEL